MEWLQAFMIAGSTIGGCYWMHRENKHTITELQKESRDFHGRMCTLEERYYQLMQKHLEDRNK